VEGRGQIPALTSGKGGVGKNHLAVRLSAALAVDVVRDVLCVTGKDCERV
jgi:MinD superfamily P-loop ATPase